MTYANVENQDFTEMMGIDSVKDRFNAMKGLFNIALAEGEIIEITHMILHIIEILHLYYHHI